MGEQAAEGLGIGLEQDLEISPSATWMKTSAGQRQDIEYVNVVVFSFGPPVSQVQQLQGKERTRRRQMSCGGKVSQEVSALPSVVPLRC